MKKLLMIFCTFAMLSPLAKADVGIYWGTGIPYLSQMGLNLTMGQNWSASVGTNTLDLSVGDAETTLSMPELMINWHPFAGSFFIGIGAGQQTLDVSATEALTGATASANVTSTTMIAKLGWMWGKANGGFWMGMDISFISPSGSEVEIDANGLTPADQEYQDVVDAGERFGETAYTNLTFLKLGYLF